MVYGGVYLSVVGVITTQDYGCMTRAGRYCMAVVDAECDSVDELGVGDNFFVCPAGIVVTAENRYDLILMAIVDVAKSYYMFAIKTEFSDTDRAIMLQGGPLQPFAVEVAAMDSRRVIVTGGDYQATVRAECC